jgi:2-dehydro-3-deoxygluconokinase
MHFARASGAYAAGSLIDYSSSPADEDAVWSIWQGNARVVR